MIGSAERGCFEKGQDGVSKTDIFETVTPSQSVVRAKELVRDMCYSSRPIERRKTACGEWIRLGLGRMP